VLSPFFDSPGKDSETVSALIDGMAQRGDRDIVFCVRREDTADHRTRLFAPLGMVKTARERCDVTIRAVSAFQDDERRSLHAKIICLENDTWCLMLAGSSNFTAAGLTAATGGNFEANLLYRLKGAEAEKDVTELWPRLDDDIFFSSSENVIWEPEPEECEGALGLVPLPACFRDAVFVAGEKPGLVIQLGEELPRSWSIASEDGSPVLSSRNESTGRYELPWEKKPVPFVLYVTWATESGTYAANWPVNIANPADLPPPEALQGLSLEELLAILSSTRSLPQAVMTVLKRREKGPRIGDIDLDPLRRLDSPAFLLRRTKRVAVALDQLKKRMERPALTKDAYDWRLNGPLGPMALAEAFANEAHLPGESQFYLAELALTLRRVDTRKAAEGGLARHAIESMLASAISRLGERALSQSSAPRIEEYVVAALDEAGAS
jgi:hypothetical protein